jgi:hypothetical protein
MSQPSAAIPQAPSLSEAPFEQQLYLRSPLGTLGTTAILFVLLFGSFLVLAALNQVPTIWRAAKGIAISGAAWPALVLSLLCCAALGMQRYSRLREVADVPAYARILTGGITSAASITSLAPRDARLGRATVIGLAVGLVMSAGIIFAENQEGHPIQPGPFVWYVFAIIFLDLLFARGVEQTRAGSRAYGRMLNAELKIDLLRIDMLSVLGRSAARTALIWFVVSAVACLFFVGNDLNWLTVALIASSMAMGVGMFANIMVRIHHQIRAAKDVELELVRRRIDALRATMHDDSGSAARMHGMLAYENRIADAAEWPFDQSTLLRVGASALILTVPWFGQAAAQYLFDHLGR